jgi:hypothetical protein
MLRSSVCLPGNQRDIEVGENHSAKAKKLERIQKYACPVVGGFVFLVMLLAYGFSSSGESTKSTLENLSRTSRPLAPDLNLSPELEMETEPESKDPQFFMADMQIYRTESEVPSEMWIPCRRLSKEEMASDLMIEGYKITDVLMSLCRVLHDQVGCDGEGSLAVKLLNLNPMLNTCILTYKDRQGKCSHFINPTIHKSARDLAVIIGVTSRNFPYAGKQPANRQKQVLVSYQTMADSAMVTNGFSNNQSMFIQNAYDVLQGAYPPRIEIVDAQ